MLCLLQLALSAWLRAGHECGACKPAGRRAAARAGVVARARVYQRLPAASAASSRQQQRHAAAWHRLDRFRPSSGTWQLLRRVAAAREQPSSGIASNAGSASTRSTCSTRLDGRGALHTRALAGREWEQPHGAAAGPTAGTIAGTVAAISSRTCAAAGRTARQ